MKNQPELASNKKYMRKLFNRLVQRFFPQGTKLKSLEIKDTSRLKFKKTYKFILGIKSPDGKKFKKTIRGNIPSEDTGKEIKIADFTQSILYKKGFAFPPYQVPLSFGYFQPLKLVLYEEYPGTTISNLIKENSPDIKKYVKLSAQWLFEFHKLKIKYGPKRTLKQISDEIGYFKDDFKNYYPGFYNLISMSLEKIYPILQKDYQKNREKYILTHGDFNPNNIIINQDNVGAIDFGNSNNYDPFFDVANFITQLDFLIWNKIANKRMVNKLQKIFISEYLSLSGLKLRRIKERLVLHQAWWTIQIMSYLISIWPTHRARRPVLKGIESLQKLLKSMGIKIQKESVLLRDKTNLKSLLTNYDVMMKYFNRNLSTFFPQAKRIIRLEVEQPPALSLSSLLTKYTLALVLKNDEQIAVNIRGNSVLPNTYYLMHYLSNKNNEFLTTPRPLFYFKSLPYIFYEAVPGNSLRKFNFKSRGFISIVKKIALALAQLHNLTPPDIDKQTIKKEADFLLAIKKILVRNLPDKQTRIIDHLASLLKEEKELFNKKLFVISHNDFQASNIIVMPGNSIGFIDFTQSNLYFPANDVAYFLTHAEIMLNEILSAKKITEIKKIFLQTYLKSAKKPISNFVKKYLSLFEIRASFDIMAITTTLLGKKDKNRRRYVKLLINKIESDIKLWQK